MKRDRFTENKLRNIAVNRGWSALVDLNRQYGILETAIYECPSKAALNSDARHVQLSFDKPGQDIRLALACRKISSGVNAA